MTLTRVRCFGIPALALLLTALLISPAASVRAQDDGPAPETLAAEPQAVQAALGTAFTYQGRLNDAGSPANGAYDFQFRLFDALSGGAQVGSALSKDDLAVSGGLFTADLDFGAGAFDGQARWLEVAVRSGASTGAYTTLAPRRALLAAPYAMYSTNSSGLRYGGSGMPFHIGTGVYGLDIGNGTGAGFVPTILGRAQQSDDTGLYLIGRVDSDSGAAPVIGINARLGSSAAVANRPVLQIDNFRTPILLAAANGNVGIGTTSPAAKLDIAGTTRTDVLQIDAGADLAERFEVSGDATPEPGAAVIADEEHPGQLTVSQQAYDTRVIGVISGAGGIQPGLTLHQEGLLDGDTQVTIAGRVYVKADASSGPIKPGDLLTTSDSAGYVMRASDRDRAFGAVVGKALTGLAEGTGLVLVLVNLQ